MGISKRPTAGADQFTHTTDSSADVLLPKFHCSDCDEAFETPHAWRRHDRTLHSQKQVIKQKPSDRSGNQAPNNGQIAFQDQSHADFFHGIHSTHIFSRYLFLSSCLTP